MKTSCARDDDKCKKTALVYQREDGSIWLHCPCGFGCIAWAALRERFLEHQQNV